MELTPEEFQRVSDKSPLDLFYQGIRAQDTKEKYTRTLKLILCKVLKKFFEGDFEQRVRELVNQTKENPMWTRDLLLNLSKKLRDRTELPKENPDYFNPSSINNYFKPIKKLFDMNDITFPWKRIYATFPEMDNIGEGRGWTEFEIQKMLKHANGAIDRAIVLFVSSSGFRSGSFDLSWEDVSPVFRINNRLSVESTDDKNAEIVCAMVKIYRNSYASYPAFITPEAYSALQDYKLEWTREVGRNPKPSEPIFKKEGMLPRRATPTSIKKRIERMVRKAGLRTTLPKGKRRYEVPLMNGFRRFWNKTCKESLSRDSPLASFIKKEYMMGHMGLFKLDKNYFKTQVTELAEEYLNVVPNLTISNESRLRAEKLRLMKEKEEFENKEIVEFRDYLKKAKANSAKINEYFEMMISNPNLKRESREYKEFCMKYGYNHKIPLKLTLQIPKESQRKMRAFYADDFRETKTKN